MSKKSALFPFLKLYLFRALLVVGGGTPFWIGDAYALVIFDSKDQPGNLQKVAEIIKREPEFYAHFGNPTIKREDLDKIQPVLSEKGLIGYWVPDTLSQLEQIYQYFSSPPFQAAAKSALPLRGVEVEFHPRTHVQSLAEPFDSSVCDVNSTMNQLSLAVASHTNPARRFLNYFQNEGKFLLATQRLIHQLFLENGFRLGDTENTDSLVDTILRKMKARLPRSPYHEKEAFGSLVEHPEILKAVIKAETDAWAHSEFLIWRFSQGYMDSSGLMLEPTTGGTRNVSYAYSVLGGWVGDGCLNADINFGIENTSASSFCYWAVHRQGVEKEQEVRKMTTNSKYITFLDNLKNHSLYAIPLTPDSADGLGLEKKSLLLPLESTYLQAIVSSGENFHPRLLLRAGDRTSLENFHKVLSKSVIVYVNGKVLGPTDQGVADQIRARHRVVSDQSLLNPSSSKDEKKVK